MVGGVVSITNAITIEGAEELADPSRLPPTARAPPEAERDALLPADDEAGNEADSKIVDAEVPREYKRFASLEAASPQFPLMLHLTIVPFQVRSAGAHVSTMLTDRVMTDTNPLSGPTAM